MTGVVIDASVAIKWVVDEEGSDDAVPLIVGPALSAPDLLTSECGNILWKKARRGELTRDEASLAMNLLARADLNSFPCVLWAWNCATLESDAPETRSFPSGSLR